MNRKPFEGLLTESNSKVIEVLLVNPDSHYFMTDLAIETGLSRPTISKVINDISRFGILRYSIGGRIGINMHSPISKAINNFNLELNKWVAIQELEKQREEIEDQDTVDLLDIAIEEIKDGYLHD